MLLLFTSGESRSSLTHEVWLILPARRPGDDHEERHVYTDDDPFFSEVSHFVDCIEKGPDPHILSSFEDATKTYEFVSLIFVDSY